MRGLACLAIIAAAGTFCLLGLTCTPATPSGDSLANAPVYITAVHALTPPAGGFESAYQATAFDIDPLDPSAGQAIGFRLTIATATPDALRTRLADLSTGSALELQSVDPPTSDEQSTSSDWLRPFNDDLSNILRAGTGVFWLDDASPDAGSLL